MTQVNSSTKKYDDLPLFAFVRRNCERCLDTGVWLTPLNIIAVCPRIQCRETHNEPNKASLQLQRSANLMVDRQYRINPMCFDLARILTNYSSEKPCTRQSLFDHFFDSSFTEDNKKRALMGWVEELQKVWLLPIGSRKVPPFGYWIITELEDFKEWFKHAKAAPITRLTTIHKVARHNFPIFAEQMELEFWNDIQTEE